MKGFALGHFETEMKGNSEITYYYSVCAGCQSLANCSQVCFNIGSAWI